MNLRKKLLSLICVALIVLFTGCTVAENEDDDVSNSLNQVKTGNIASMNAIKDKGKSMIPLNSATGFVDSVNEGVASGWFYDPIIPYGGGLVSICVDYPVGTAGCTIIASGSANLSRPDVATALGISSGKYGFKIQLPTEYADSYRGLYFYGVTVDGKVVQLANSPITTMGTAIVKTTVPDFPCANKAMAYAQLELFANQKKQVEQIIKNEIPEPEIVFLGDSITQLMSDFINQAGNGTEVWRALGFADNSINFGIGGDTTQGLLYRIIDGGLSSKMHPKVIVLLIGTNNINKETSEYDVEFGVTAVTRLIHATCKDAKILIVQILPRGTFTDEYYQKRLPINNFISKLADGNKIFTLNLDSQFMNPIAFKFSGKWYYGQLYADRYYEQYGSHLLHPSKLGYQYMLTEIRKKILEIAPEVSF